MNNSRSEFAAPLGSATVGDLKFVGGADRVGIRAEDLAEHLYRASFEGTAPDVRVEGGTVEIEYPWTWNPLDRRRHSADVALNARLPWRIEIGGGSSNLRADLGVLQLESLEIDGGVSDVELTLPEPSGTVSVRIEGGANDLRVRRPNGVPARLRVGSGASNLALDAQRLGAAGGDTALESGDYAGATDRYEISVTGGANNVSVDAL